MRNTIIILLLSATTLCYGQNGKYTVCKTYQYEGVDSARTKWVCTKKYNAHGKIIYARYKGYINSESGFRNQYDMYSGYPCPTRYVNGKSYYIYNDTLLKEEIHIAKTHSLDTNGSYAEHKTFEDSDSLKVSYSYDIDTNGFITGRQMIETHKRTDLILHCGEAMNYPGKISRKEQLEAIAKTNTEFKNRKWSQPDTTTESIEHIDCGILSIYSKMHDGLFTILTYNYDKECKIIAKQAYECTEGNCNSVNMYYKHYGDTIKVLMVYNRDLSAATIKGNSITIEADRIETLLYNSRNMIALEILNDHMDAEEKTFVYYYYDTYDRLIKDITYTNDCGFRTITHLYTYE